MFATGAYDHYNYMETKLESLLGIQLKFSYLRDSQKSIKVRGKSGGLLNTRGGGG